MDKHLKSIKNQILYMWVVAEWYFSDPHLINFGIMTLWLHDI